MGQTVLAESAWNELDHITDYIAIDSDSPRYAREFSDRIFQRIEQLKNFPKSGREVPEFENELIRELILGKYRIVNRI